MRCGLSNTWEIRSQGVSHLINFGNYRNIGACTYLICVSVSVSGDYGLADRNNGFFSVVKRRSLTTLPSLLSDSINCLKKLKGMGDSIRKQIQAVDEPVEGCVSVWLLKRLRARKRRPSLKRTYELFGSLLTSMNSGGKNGSKSAERSSPTPDSGVGLARTPWLGCRSS